MPCSRWVRAFWFISRVFLPLGIFWSAQQVQLSPFARVDRHLTSIHIAFLATVAVTPFSTALPENFIQLRIPLAIFWLNLLLLGLKLYASWRYASANGLLRNDVSLETKSAIGRRIILAEALYAVGFACCIFSTFLSIVAIAVVQFVLAFAPTIWRFKRQTLLGPRVHHRNAKLPPID